MRSWHASLHDPHYTPDTLSSFSSHTQVLFSLQAVAAAGTLRKVAWVAIIMDARSLNESHSHLTPVCQLYIRMQKNFALVASCPGICYGQRYKSQCGGAKVLCVPCRTLDARGTNSGYTGSPHLVHTRPAGILHLPVQPAALDLAAVLQIEGRPGVARVYDGVQPHSRSQRIHQKPVQLVVHNHASLQVPPPRLAMSFVEQVKSCTCWGGHKNACWI